MPLCMNTNCLYWKGWALHEHTPMPGPAARTCANIRGVLIFCGLGVVSLGVIIGCVWFLEGY